MQSGKKQRDPSILFLPHHVLNSWRDSHSVVQNRLVLFLSCFLYTINNTIKLKKISSLLQGIKYIY